MLIPVSVKASDDNGLTFLDGNWFFIADSLVDPQHASGISWKQAELPGSWNSYHSSGGPFGYGTYYRKIKIPDSLAERGALRFPDVLSAHRVYVNGQFLYESGKVAKQARDEEFGNYRYIQPLPARLVPGDSVEILVHVSNFGYRKGGILRSVELGPHEKMLNTKNRSLFFEALQLGGVIVMGAFFLIYFLFRRQDRYIITFSLLCLGIFTYVLFNSEYVLFLLLPGLSGETILEMIFITFYFTVTINLILISQLFPEEIPYWLVQITKIVGLLFILVVILLPMRIYTYSFPVFRIYAVISGLYLIYKVMQAALHNRSGAKIIWLATSIIFIFMVNDMLYNAQVINTGEIVGYGVTFYLMILMVVSSRRFSRAVSNEEKLLKDLKKLNDNLTYKVRERTQDLEDKSRIIADQQLQILRKNQELIRAREEEKNIIKSTVHDLKAPFNRLKGLIQLFALQAQEKNSPEELEEIVEMIKHVADEGESMVEDLNVVTFFEDNLSGNEDIEEIDLMHLLGDLVLGYRGYAEKKKIELEFTSPVKKYLIETHVKSLTRIVDNLLSNAIKFSVSDTRVWMSLRPYHDYFEIFIKDEGPGFTEEDKKVIFKKFKKLSARPTSGETSTGLGLNIVKTLTEGMNGSVELLHSTSGAHFKVKFARKVRVESDQTDLDEDAG